jgi:hypothetical protein
MSDAADDYDPSTDILYGARAVAKWLFNDDSDEGRKRVYYLNSIKSGVPFFKTGNTICLSKRAYLAWVAGGEALKNLSVKFGRKENLAKQEPEEP